MRHKSLTAILFGALLAAACQKHVPVAVLSPSAAPVPSPSSIALEQGDRAFDTASYDESIRAYERYLQLAPAGDRRDQVLFRVGLMCVLPGKSNPDWIRAEKYFGLLASEYPASTLTPPAQLILALRSQLSQLSADTQKRDERIRQLSSELDKLKQIDAERRRRP